MSRHTIVTQAADVVLDWSGVDVLHTINVDEAGAIAELFRLHGRGDVAEHIVRETWSTERVEDRDPFPWLLPDGTRAAVRPPDGPGGRPRFAARGNWSEG